VCVFKDPANKNKIDLSNCLDYPTSKNKVDLNCSKKSEQG